MLSYKLHLLANNESVFGEILLFYLTDFMAEVICMWT